MKKNGEGYRTGGIMLSSGEAMTYQIYENISGVGEKIGEFEASTAW